MRRVNMYVDRPSCIELHVRETVRIDRLQPTAADGYVAEQHGALLAPGVTQLQLETGDLSLSHPGRCPAPRHRGRRPGDQHERQDPKTPPYSGHGPCGRVPALRVVDDTEVAP